MICLVQKHSVLGSWQSLEPGVDGQVDDGDAEDGDQDPDPVGDNTSGRPVGIIFAGITKKEKDVTYRNPNTSVMFKLLKKSDLKNRIILSITLEAR